MFFWKSLVFHELAGVGNLTSAFSKTSLNIWKFTVHLLLKPGLENFEHYFASVWDECNCAVVWTIFALPFFGIGMKTHLFQSCGHCWAFQICWHIECSTFTASSFCTSSSFHLWNSSTGIPSPPLAFLRLSWLHIPRCLALGEWSHHRDYLGHEDLFRIVLLGTPATSS